jgi:hypothetical protein
MFIEFSGKLLKIESIHGICRNDVDNLYNVECLIFHPDNNHTIISEPYKKEENRDKRFREIRDLLCVK